MKKDFIVLIFNHVLANPLDFGLDELGIYWWIQDHKTRKQWTSTVVPTKSDSDEIFCLQLLNKTLTCTLHLS